jgi:2-dehydro-3-deoxy-L-rhamnonate dehydrogenase (NAD+)
MAEPATQVDGQRGKHGARRRALIVGAASGIGAAVTRHLLALGWQAVAADRDEDGLERLPDRGELVDRLVLDVTDAASVTSGVTSAERSLGELDVLVNCAGSTGGGWRSLRETPVAQLDALYEVNLRGAYLLTQAVLPAMVERRYGRILHVASIAGKEGVPGMSTYCATKAGLIGMVKAVAKEVAEAGVTINALAPAIIRTALTTAMPEEQFAYLRDLVPMRRPGELEEAVAMIAWIVSPEASFTTGFTYDLSGGRADY